MLLGNCNSWYVIFNAHTPSNVHHMAKDGHFAKFHVFVTYPAILAKWPWHMTSFVNEQVLSDFSDRRTRCFHVIKEDGEVLQRSFCLFSYLLTGIVQLVVNSSCVSQTFHSVFFPTWTKWDTVSNLCKHETQECQGSLWTEWRAGMYLKLFPQPKALQSSICSVWASSCANTTTSVSTVQTRILWKSCITALPACTTILESASSWLQGAMLLVYHGGEHSTLAPSVTVKAWSADAFSIGSSFRNLNKSVLLLLKQRN